MRISSITVAEFRVLVCFVRVVDPSVDHREVGPAFQSLEVANGRPFLGTALLAALRGGVVHTGRRDDETRVGALGERGKQQLGQGEMAEVVRPNSELKPVRSTLRLLVGDVHAQSRIQHQRVEWPRLLLLSKASHRSER